ncbi:MAG: DUF3108 domain-containing protein [Flavobacteriales bacterium]|nr:DUF3108 domain-containing protein [Flavobacteriales bacterium]
MKTPFLTTVLMALTTISVMAQSYRPPKVNLDLLPKHSLRAHENKAWKSGEIVNYRVHYGLMNAGIASISVLDSKETFNGRPAYHIVGEGKSIGSFDWFFKVRDKYESFIDKEGIFPHRFVRNCDEGGYKIYQDYTFYPEKRAMSNHKKETYMTPDFVQDMISSYFYARTLDFSKCKPGDVFTVNSILDDEIYPLKMKYIGKEQVKVDAGTFNCLKFVPVVAKGRVFKKEEDLVVWVTDDANHLPVLAKAKILVGSIKMEMISYTGLANPISKVK